MKLYSKIHNNNTLRNKSKLTLMDGSSFNRCPSTDDPKEAKKKKNTKECSSRVNLEMLLQTSRDHIH